MDSGEVFGPLLYVNTLKHLRISQVWHRLRLKLTRPEPRPIGLETSRLASFLPLPQGATPAASMRGPQTFRFLGDEREFAVGQDAAAIHPDKLWRYNLHYFDDLNAAAARERSAWHRAWILRWLAENPPAAGDGWEPYPTSLRIVNWVRWLLRDNTPVAGMLESLAIQADWLSKCIEWHLLGNHLLANAKALVFTGLAFEGGDAARWLTTGLRILDAQLTEQILTDGVHFERSPMYHAIVLCDLFDLIAFVEADPYQTVGTVGLRAKAQDMLAFAEQFTHPDGEIALFNDAAFGIAPRFAELADYAARLGIAEKPETPECASCGALTVTDFPSAGYTRLDEPAAAIFLDRALVGPDYLPAHAHADTLAFELSVRGQRVVVNGGTSRYGEEAIRRAERSTAAHSTVEVSGQSSSEVWRGFRVARRARPFGVATECIDDHIQATGSHDGYRRLGSPAVHRREWTLETGRLRIIDRLLPKGGGHSAVARFHLHPQVRCVQNARDRFDLSLPDGSKLTAHCKRGRASIGPSHYAPRFGERVAAEAIEIELVESESCLLMDWNGA